MAGPPPRRLARAPARLPAAPLRAEGAGRRPPARLSPVQASAAACNQKLSRLLHLAAAAANLQQSLSYKLKSRAYKGICHPLRFRICLSRLEKTQFVIEIDVAINAGRSSSLRTDGV